MVPRSRAVLGGKFPAVRRATCIRLIATPLAGPAWRLDNESLTTCNRLGRAQSRSKSKVDWKRHSIIMRFFDDPQLLWTGLYSFTAIAAIVVMIWISLRIRSWFREDEDPAAETGQMLVEFRDLHRRGGLTEDEYRLIKGRLMNGGSPPAERKNVADQSNSSGRD